jgi:hypothetical protein
VADLERLAKAMLPSLENQTWLIDTGDVVLKKESAGGVLSLTRWERLVYRVWVADYGMCNAGDLDTAADVHPRFQEEAAELAKELSLAFTYETFSLSKEDLQLQYFERFDRLCDELKKSA